MFAPYVYFPLMFVSPISLQLPWQLVVSAGPPSTDLFVDRGAAPMALWASNQAFYFNF